MADTVWIKAYDLAPGDIILDYAISFDGEPVLSDEVIRVHRSHLSTIMTVWTIDIDLDTLKDDGHSTLYEACVKTFHEMHWVLIDNG